jgi:hypothetical protein
LKDIGGRQDVFGIAYSENDEERAHDESLTALASDPERTRRKSARKSSTNVG